MLKCWHITIELLDDLHTGTGTGFGDIDALQTRDHRGQPMIPASHLKGVWREAAEEWHQLAPENFPQDVIDRLFGCPGKGQSVLQITGAYLEQGNRTLIWGNTSIDRQTGGAQEKSLHFVEYIPAGVRLHLSARLYSPEEQDAERFLALLRRCPALGGKRRRGHGRIRWHIKEAPSQAMHDFSPPSAQTRPARQRLLLRALDSICLAKTGHPGNLIFTETFLRGRGLRGACTAACLTMGQEDWADTLLDPRIAWGDALPLPDTEFDLALLAQCEVYPIPLSLGTPKKKAVDDRIPWWARSGREDKLGMRGEIDQLQSEIITEKLKRPAEGELLFRAQATAPWQRYLPKRVERLHAAVPRAANAWQQGFFITEEIAKDTLFLAELQVSDVALADKVHMIVHQLGRHWLRVGRGGRPMQIEAAGWLPLYKHPPAKGDSFILRLESDLIARDAFGNDHERLDARLIGNLAGLPEAKIEMAKGFSESVTLYGFNAMTGLPRQARRAIKAGSVAHIKGEDALKVREALAAKLVLGDLAEEGFGRFRLDDMPNTLMQDAALPDTQHTQDSYRLERLCQEVEDWVQANFDRCGLGTPSPSQWAEVRELAQIARTTEDLVQIFKGIEAASQKQGGKAWKIFVENKSMCFQHMLDHLQSRPLEDAKAWLGFLIRWVRVKHAAPRSTP